MSWFTDSIKNVLPVADDVGMVVRPVFSGSDPNVLTVRHIFSGSNPDILTVRPIFSGSDPNVLTVDIREGINLVNDGELRPATTSVDAVVYSTSMVILKGSNETRRGLSVYNDSNRNLFLKEGSDATTESWTVKIPPNALYELAFPPYTGVITGFWAAGGSGKARVTERKP